MQNLKKILIVFFLSCWLHPSSATTQEKKLNKNPFITGIRLHHGRFLVHTDKLKPLQDAIPMGVEISLSQHYLSQKAWSYCNCYPRMGLSLYYWDFNHTALGKVFTSLFYLEPFFSSPHKIKLSTRAGLGVAYLTNPFHETENPENLAYSSSISFPLLLNMSMHYYMHPRWSLVFSVNYQHISNGGIKQPNYGINYPSINLGVDYILSSVEFPARKKIKFKDIPEKIQRWDLSLFIAYKDVESTDTTKQPVLGVNLLYIYQVGKLSALAAGIDMAADYGAKHSVKNTPDKNDDFKRVSVVLGHDLLLGRFIFSQHVGAYIYRPYPFSDPVFQRYKLYFFVNRRFHVGISLKAHRHVAEYLDLRVGVAF